MQIKSSIILDIVKMIIFRPVPLQLFNTEILLHFLELEKDFYIKCYVGG